MPVGDISGLSTVEGTIKAYIREKIKKYFEKTLGSSRSGTDVNFITSEEELDHSKHVMVRLYSKSFMTMDQEGLDVICDDVIEIVEKAGHEFAEVIIIPIMAMKGRYRSKRKL